MKCPKCGYELNDDAEFCIYCGNRMDGKRPSAQKNNSNKLIVLVIVVTVLILAGLFGGYFLLTMDRDDPDAGYIPEETYSSGDNFLPDPTAPTEEEPAPTDPVEETDPEEPTGTETEPEGEQETEPATEPETEPATEPAPQETEPPVGQGDGTADGSEAGIPGLALDEAKLSVIHDAYWSVISGNKNAVSYGMLNMFGDVVPELILKWENDKGESYYDLYFLLEGQAVLIQKGPVEAGSDDVLYGNNGTLIIAHNSMVATCVTINKTLSVEASTVLLETAPVYTDSVLLCAADDEALLNLILYGEDGFKGCSGWVRYGGRDYHYDNGRPNVNKWFIESDVMYYVGNEGYVAYIATEDILTAMLDEYCQGFADAINAQDVSLLKNVTEANRKDTVPRLTAEWVQYRSFAGYEFDWKLEKCDDATGKIQLYLNVDWILRGDWAGAKDEISERSYYMTLVWQNDQWLADVVGCL